MGSLNTALRGVSAHYNRRAAQATADTSRAVGQMAAADRHRELRDRGLITHRSTPTEIAAVEDRLAAQMRARDLLAGNTPTGWPYTDVAAAAVLVAIVAAGAVGGGLRLGGVGAVAAFVAAAFAVWAVGAPKVRRREEQRSATVASADWHGGVCGWCGSPDEHLVDGEPEHPLVAHAEEVEAEAGR